MAVKRESTSCREGERNHTDHIHSIKNQNDLNGILRIKKTVELQIMKKILFPKGNSQITLLNMQSPENFISHVPFLKKPLRMHYTRTRTQTETEEDVSYREKVNKQGCSDVFISQEDGEGRAPNWQSHIQER